MNIHELLYILYNYIGLLFLAAVSFIQVINNYGQTCGEEALHPTEIQSSPSLQNGSKSHLQRPGVTPTYPTAFAFGRLPKEQRVWVVSVVSIGVESLIKDKRMDSAAQLLAFI